MKNDAVMGAAQALYSLDDVAARLGLHVRTVRAYVRDGRLKATRIGKQYRVAQADLDSLVGVPAAMPAPAGRSRHVEVSCIVDIEAISPDAASRMTNGLMGAANSHARNRDGALRVDAAYDETRARLKLIFSGAFAPVSAMMQMAGAYLDPVP